MVSPAHERSAGLRAAIRRPWYAHRAQVLELFGPVAGDGIDAALEIFKSKGIRSLFASAFADAETHRRAQAAAPLGWLAKPYTINSLVQAVRTAVQDLGGPEAGQS
jgi:DNA-binding NarL/FixJ family response regulator